MFGSFSIQAQNYKTHKVKQGESIESITKLYHVSAKDIYSLNPDAKKGIKPNTVLIIPNSKTNDQAPQATIEKELVGFKQHKVKRKETLYSLAKEYDVTQDELKKHNTFLYANNLKKGDDLKIPVYKKVLVVSEPESNTKIYTVLPKEGKWRIAYKFGITVDQLEEINPGMSEVLNDGDQIFVPNIQSKEEKPIDEAYSYYKVLPKEGFYRIKLKLGLEQDQLETLNPELKEFGLKEGMILKVPYNVSLEKTVIVEEEEIDLTDNIKSYKSKHLVIMLPFQLNKVEIDSVQDSKRELATNPYLSTSLDFYSGALMALDSLKKLGISLKVDVYDTRNSLSEVSNILNTHSFNDVNAVIGPFMPNNIEKVASELKSFNIPVISPITKNVDLSENVFQSRPSEDMLYDKMVNYIKSDSTKNHVIIVSDSKHTKVNDNLKRTFLSASQVFSRKNKDGKDGYYVLDDDLLNKLKPGKNVVFLESDNPGFISNVTSKLNSLNNSDTRSIVLVTTNLNSAFEDYEVSNYHLSNLQFHFPTISRSYNEDDKNPFVKAYEKRYGVTPNKVAVRGFDLTMDVVLRLVTSEDLYLSVTETPLTEYVENKFAYKKKFLSGYYNDTVYLVKYQDLKIVEVE
jgi:LysM repeat protein